MGGNRVTIKQGLIEIVADTTVNDTFYAPEEVWSLPALPTMPTLVLALEASAQVSRKGVRVTFPGKLPGTDSVAWAIERVDYQGAAPVPLVWTSEPIVNPSALNNLYAPLPGATFRVRLVSTEPGKAPVRYPEATVATPGDTSMSDLAAAIDPDTLNVIEKVQIIQDYAALTAENANLVAQANTYGVSHTAYDAAYTALVTTYLPSLTTPTAWNALTGTTALGTGNRVALWNPKWTAVRNTAADLCSPHTRG